MAFLLYFVVLVVCAGTVLFGLDWMNSPLPEVHKPPMHVAKVEPKAKPVKRVDASPAVADPKSQLSPIHPAVPATVADNAAKNDNVQPKENPAPKTDTTVAANSNQKPNNGNTRAETSGAAVPPSGNLPAAPALAAQANAALATQAHNEQVANVPPADTQPKAQPLADAQPKADAQANQQANAAPAQCDVSACAAAYQSFRASDCTYQPFSGPRRVCTSPAGGNIAARGNIPAQPRNQTQAAFGSPQRDDGDLDDATREVRRLTARDRNRLRDEDDDDGDHVVVRRSVRPAPFPFEFFHPGDDD